MDRVEGGSLLLKARAFASLQAQKAETHSPPVPSQKPWRPGIHPQDRKQFGEPQKKNLKILILKISKRRSNLAQLSQDNLHSHTLSFQLALLSP